MSTYKWCYFAREYDDNGDFIKPQTRPRILAEFKKRGIKQKDRQGFSSEKAAIDHVKIKLPDLLPFLSFGQYSNL